MNQVENHREEQDRPPVRVVTAASLFDGHDAAINIMRRLLQARGAEVIHLGHDRGVEEVVEAIVEEAADAVAISSYQGGHIEYFEYLVRRLAEEGLPHVRVYGGGGGTITPGEIVALHRAGVSRIFSPEDGRKMGLEGMIGSIVDECLEARRRFEADPLAGLELAVECLDPDHPAEIARLISFFENHAEAHKEKATAIRKALSASSSREAPVIGFTGTGGAGKSSVVDELVMRLRRAAPKLRIALLLVDPTRRRSGGALLGDRIRMNAIGGEQVFVRSMATRRANVSLAAAVGDGLHVLRSAGFDLVLLETAGIGQSDSEIVDQVDLSIYVMTPDYGAPSQLEKIDMIDFADMIVLNKFDRRGSLDSLRDIRKQWRRNRKAMAVADEDVPVFPTIARNWNDPGTDRLAEALERRLVKLGLAEALLSVTAVRSSAHSPGAAPELDEMSPSDSRFAKENLGRAAGSSALVPASRQRYLAEIVESLRSYRSRVEASAEEAALADGYARVLSKRGDRMAIPLGPLEEGGASEDASLREGYRNAASAVDPALAKQLHAWPETKKSYAGETQTYGSRDRSVEVENFVSSLSGTQIPVVALPRNRDWGELVRYFGLENLPGRFPFTAGVFPFKRKGEDPTRMFAGEGGPERTNRRFHYLSSGQPAARLSTAFDSVTLYGSDPAEAPDIFGKVGNSGVSVCTLDDAKKLYSGFDLAAATTSVSLTINGPAPTVLAFFLNAAIDQRVERYLAERGELDEVRAKTEASLRDRGLSLPVYKGERAPDHDGLGLGLLGIPGDQVVPADVYRRIREEVLQTVRGTVQADILKEDQAQNTCIFSTEFSLKMQGDIQQTFCREGIRNFYSISISGYHMAEAGANPITQLAFTLANGFTFCEYFLARGMTVDEFAPNFSFFFSNGLDAEYSVLGRVARRIWAVAMSERYGASERSQKLKYHIQTSGRSLHAQEMDFNDIRTTLQALTALQDSCNSLHTNAYDEAVTTPTEASVRRALAIQLIINREAGLMRNENSVQGAFVIEELTDLVEEAVMQEFERLSERGGVLGAMETLYQRGRIQDESMDYEKLKHSGELEIIGVNSFLAETDESSIVAEQNLIRSSEEERRAQLDSLADFHARWTQDVEGALDELKQAALAGENLFDVLLETVKVASLGQISEALFEVGGRYRRAV